VRSGPFGLPLSRQRIALIVAGAAAAVVLLAVGIPLLLSLGSNSSVSANPFTRSASPSVSPARSAGPSATPSQSASPSPRPINVGTGNVRQLPPLPHGTPERRLGSHTVIILLNNQLWWCTSAAPKPTGCRQVELSKALSRLHVRQQFNQIEMCASGPSPVIELPSIPDLGGPGGVRVTFNPGFVASLAASPTGRCPLAG
jgi:hypothetical protein